MISRIRTRINNTKKSKISKKLFAHFNFFFSPLRSVIFFVGFLTLCLLTLAAGPVIDRVLTESQTSSDVFIRCVVGNRDM